MPDGASFAASDMRKKTDTGEWLEANDDWFRPVSEQVGPDGALWIMDWYDAILLSECPSPRSGSHARPNLARGLHRR